jgi:hypothetical protein
VTLMQYEIVLPADYDMGIIEDRVATRARATDDFPGLGLKAYAVRRRGRRGSPVNAYAPFYSWADSAGLVEFLQGPFRAIVDDFGRPAVNHWVTVAHHRGPARSERPTLAVREQWTLEADRAPADLLAEHREEPVLPAGVHSQAVGLDPHAWSLVRFTLWSTAPPVPPAGATVFDVLHLSDPGLDRLLPP